MFLSIYEGVRLIVFVVAVQRDRIHKSQEVLPIWAYKFATKQQIGHPFIKVKEVRSIWA